MNRHMVNIVLLLLCLVSGFAAVHTQYSVRKLYVAQAELEGRARSLAAEKQNLILDQERLSNQGYIQRRAETELRMVPVNPLSAYFPDLRAQATPAMPEPKP